MVYLFIYFFVVHLMTLSAAQTMQCQVVRLMDNELESI
jgi:hypothetical protein